MKSKEYIVMENMTLAFETHGRQYKLGINIVEGLLILDEYENSKKLKTTCKILGYYEPYFGEVKEEVKDNFISTEKCENEPSSSLKSNQNETNKTKHGTKRKKKKK